VSRIDSQPPRAKFIRSRNTNDPHGRPHPPPPQAKPLRPGVRARYTYALLPPPRAYPDLHDHIAALDRAGLLVTRHRPINKDTEMHPLVRWQFRGGIEEKDRKAFLFKNVVDSKGRKYDIPVLVGGLAANREIYRIGIGCELDEIDARWVKAAANPIPPRVVENAPCHEIVITGKATSTSRARASTASRCRSPRPAGTSRRTPRCRSTSRSDPDTGVQNMGNYRGQVKARRRLGMNPSLELRPGIYIHWERLRARGFKKLPCAVVLGAPPCITFTSVQKLPETLDELHVAGALVGAPINVVKAKTVDLLVPAEAEIVIEGFIDTEWLEPEAPFGESHGHVNLQEFNAYMDVTAITRARTRS
jgi:3-polyprenyl-4-hydroxybenzoate decarboxylase